MKTKTKMMLFTGVILFLVCNMTDNAKSETVIQFTDSEPNLVITKDGFQDGNIASNSLGNGIYEPLIPYENISSIVFERENQDYEKVIDQVILNMSQVSNQTHYNNYKENDGIMGQDWDEYTDFTYLTEIMVESGTLPIITDSIDLHRNVIDFIDESEIKIYPDTSFEKLDIWIKTSDITSDLDLINLYSANNKIVSAFYQTVSGKFGYYDNGIPIEFMDSNTDWNNIGIRLNVYPEQTYDLFFNRVLIQEDIDLTAYTFGANVLRINADSNVFIDGMGFDGLGYQDFTNYPKKIGIFKDYKSENTVNWPESGDISDLPNWIKSSSTETSVINFDGHKDVLNITSSLVNDLVSHSFIENNYAIDFWFGTSDNSKATGYFLYDSGWAHTLARAYFKSDGYIEFNINSNIINIPYQNDVMYHIRLEYNRNAESYWYLDELSVLNATAANYATSFDMVFFFAPDFNVYLDSYGYDFDGYIAGSNLNPNSEYLLSEIDLQETKINYAFENDEFIKFSSEGYFVGIRWNWIDVIVPGPVPTLLYGYWVETHEIPYFSEQYISIHIEQFLRIDETEFLPYSHVKRIVIYVSDTLINDNPRKLLELESYTDFYTGTPPYMNLYESSIDWNASLNSKEVIPRYRFLHSMITSEQFSALDNLFNVEVYFIEDPFINPDLPTTPDFPAIEEPDLPYWNYQSFRLVSETSRTIEFSQDYESVNHSDDSIILNQFEYEYEFDDLSVESTTNKYFYNPNTITASDWGDWGINNWMRNLMVVVVNALVYLFQMIMYLMTIAFQFLLLQPILYIIVLVWNFPIYWVMFGVIGIVFYLIFAFVWLWEMASRFLYWLWEDIILPIWDWIMAHIIIPAWDWIVENSTNAWNWFKEEGIIWLFETLILVIAFLLTVVIYVITFGAVDWDTTINLLYDLIEQLNSVFINFIGIFMNHGIVLFQYMVVYVILVGFLVIKMIYAKSRGYVSRSERLQSAINVFKMPITITIAIFQTIVGFFMAKSESSEKD